MTGLLLCLTARATKYIYDNYPEIFDEILEKMKRRVPGVEKVETQDGYIVLRKGSLAESCVNISKEDWDSFETSWDFQIHPIVKKALSRFHRNYEGDITIEYIYKYVAQEFENRFQRLKENEEEMNRIFIADQMIKIDLDDGVKHNYEIFKDVLAKIK